MTVEEEKMFMLYAYDTLEPVTEATEYDFLSLKSQFLNMLETDREELSDYEQELLNSLEEDVKAITKYL